MSLHAQIVKSIVGQSMFQLGVMYALVYHADAVFGMPSGSADFMDGPSVHYTLVFNSFVLMQLFNQVRLSCIMHLILPCSFNSMLPLFWHHSVCKDGESIRCCR